MGYWCWLTVHNQRLQPELDHPLFPKDDKQYRNLKWCPWREKYFQFTVVQILFPNRIVTIIFSFQVFMVNEPSQSKTRDLATVKSWTQCCEILWCCIISINDVSGDIRIPWDTNVLPHISQSSCRRYILKLASDSLSSLMLKKFFKLFSLLCSSLKDEIAVGIAVT